MARDAVTHFAVRHAVATQTVVTPALDAGGHENARQVHIVRKFVVATPYGLLGQARQRQRSMRRASAPMRHRTANLSLLISNHAFSLPRSARMFSSICPWSRVWLGPFIQPPEGAGRRKAQKQRAPFF